MFEQYKGGVEKSVSISMFVANVVHLLRKIASIKVCIRITADKKFLKNIGVLLTPSANPL